MISHQIPALHTNRNTNRWIVRTFHLCITSVKTFSNWVCTGMKSSGAIWSAWMNFVPYKQKSTNVYFTDSGWHFMFCPISFLTLKRWKNQAFQFSNALYHNMRERVSFSILVRRKLVFSLILIIPTTVQWWFSHWFHLLSFQILSSSWWDKWRTITWRSPSISNPEIQHSTVCLYSWNKDCDDEIDLFLSLPISFLLHFLLFCIVSPLSQWYF